MNYRTIELKGRNGSVRGVVKVDIDADLGDWSWHLTGAGYAARSTRKPRKRMIYMHREVLGLADDDRRQVDHINGDKLDNRSANLRAVSRTGNGLNRHTATGTSRFRGVFWNKQRGKWRAQVAVAGRNHVLGDFPVESDAARAVSGFLAEHDITAAVNAAELFAETMTAEEWNYQRRGATRRLLATFASELPEIGNTEVAADL